MNNVEWIFYLKLSPKLTQKEILISQSFSNRGIKLIPIKFQDLVELSKSEGLMHVVAIASTKKEATYYLRRVSKVMKYLIRARKVNLFMSSSFSFMDQMLGELYNFTQLPVDSDQWCDSIVLKTQVMQLEENKWPGGKNPRMVIEK